MRILLTNDDGFFAPGLQALYQTLASDGYEVGIVAPEGQRSAAGHAITLFEPLFVNAHQLPFGGEGFSVRGTPSDCVKLAIQGGIVAKPDLLISGINLGQNLGTDVFYSGTVAAALEGVLLGVPALAVSLASYQFGDFQPAAGFVRKLLKDWSLITDGGLVNINIPGTPAEEWRGVKVTRLGKAIYENIFERRQDPRGKTYYWQSGTLTPDYEEDTDLRAVGDGYVSLTPMHSDLTDYKRLKSMSQLMDQFMS
ncbi:5'/3'-nucleotidase SurE [Paradesulfitobacterium ferrireducens]|uniref:5'/3'-nucleotidase SurE n=1 Tax=Paradesulfitobacterium ferrireducens TaxID=2816476 RepID=UPI001A8E2488|nr:5'/3'-nucleotidase SurE [Paradesulfitobacterium ferrireducens]